MSQNLCDARNHLRVSPLVVLAGQPSDAQLADARRQGVEVVINLGLLDPAYCLPDERATAAALGLEYHHLPVKFDAPGAEQLERFRAVMLAARDRHVLVHCAANYRATVFFALHAMLDLGWSREQADALIGSVWQPDPCWQAFLASHAARSAGVPA